MKTVKNYFKDYDAYHKTYGNKVTHIFGISILVITVLGLLSHVTLFQWDLPIKASLALVVWVIGNLFYLKLHFKLGLTMIVSTGIFMAAGSMLPVPVLWILFVLGWIFQYIGHYVYEKKSPAFYKNLVHLMIGPAYIQNYFLKIVRW